MYGLGIDLAKVDRRVRACDYLVVAQLFLQDNFLLERPLTFSDIKPRLLGHWGSCHGINVAYSNFRARFPKGSKFSFILGPGHGFPALQANLFLDGDLAKVDRLAQRNAAGLAYLCQKFSWPSGYPSHASPATPGVVCEGGELGYALATAYGVALGHPERRIAVLIGDGEFETATALSSMNLVKLLGNHEANGQVLPILHLNSYKISAPTIYGRKSSRELHELIRGFGYQPIDIHSDRSADFQAALSQSVEHPFYILHTTKGDTGPTQVAGQKVAGNYLAHQIPLPAAKTDPQQLAQLQDWLTTYRFSELFDAKKGFTL